MAEKAVKSFLKEKLNNPNKYKAISFEQVDTITEGDTLRRVLEYCNLFVSVSADSQNLKKTIAHTEKELSKPGIDTNIVYYSIIHKYAHLGLDNEPVELEVRFVLDPKFNVSAYDRGIQGQGFFDVIIATSFSDLFKVERYELDGKSYTISTVRHRLPYGNHTLKWWKADKLMLSEMYLPEFSYDKDLTLTDNVNDSLPGIRIFVIDGDFVFSYDSKEEFEEKEKSVNFSF
jgi:hypothetical protein